MITKETWVIMSKCRSIIAVGNPRDRKLVKIGDAGSQRILTYNSEGKAVTAYTRHGFYSKYKTSFDEPDLELEGVKVSIEYKEVTCD